MRARFLLAALVVLTAALPAAGQEFLPSNLPGWTAGPLSRVGSRDFQKAAGGLGPVLREYGTQFLETRTYSRGDLRLAVVVYRMNDASGAYGLFTFLRDEHMESGKLGRFSALSSSRALVLVGDLVLDVSGSSLTSQTADLNALASQLYPRARLGTLPAVGEHLPAKGLVPHTQRYVAGPIALGRVLPPASGDWVGFSDGAEVILARYRIQGEEITLLVASYPTPQVAARRMGQIEGQALGSSNGKGEVAVKRSVSLVAIAVGATSKGAAESLLGSVRYESDITWNEPGYSANDPTIPQMVLQAIFGTGGMLILTIISGVLFAGFRLLIKRLFPGKIFDRPENVEILQLGITSKPIEGKDFY